MACQHYGTYLKNFINIVENANDDLTRMFLTGLGTLPGKVHLQVEPDCKPIILPGRKVCVCLGELQKRAPKAGTS